MAFNLPYSNDEDTRFIRKRLLRSAVKKRTRFIRKRLLRSAVKKRTRFIRKRLLRSAVKKRKDERCKLEKEFEKIHSKVCSILNVIDQYITSSLIKKNVKAMVKSRILTHEKKLLNLTQNTVLPFTSTDTVLNLSSSKLNDQEIDFLRYGLKHSVEPNFINKTDILSTFDFIHQTMSQDLKDEKDTGKVNARMSYLANTYVIQNNKKRPAET